VRTPFEILYHDDGSAAATLFTTNADPRKDSKITIVVIIAIKDFFIFLFLNFISFFL
jgi:hypothetical protein